MKLLTMLSFFITSVFMSSLSFAVPPNWRSVDVLPLDVASVKIGMSYDEASSAVAKHFKLSLSEIKLMKDSTQQTYSSITRSNQPSNMRYRKGETSIEVSFSLRVPVDKSNSVAVSRVYYSIPNTRENVDALKEAAIAKYGQPSDDRRIAVFHWCAHYNQVATCDPLKPSLSLSTGALVLVDPTIDQAAREYENNLLKTKPNI